MDELGYIQKHWRNRVIRIVDNTSNLVKDYLNKSERFFESGVLLADKAFLESAVADFYYSTYYSLLALLYKCNIKCENHNVSIILLKMLFRKDDLFELISYAKDERIDKQYYVDSRTTKDEVNELKRKVKKFNFEIKLIIEKLVEDDIEKIKDNLRKIVKT